MPTKTTLRRLALVATLGGGIWLGLTACDGAAHADDTPAAVAESPGGALGDLLDQTTDTVAEVVDEVLPEPAKEPEPETPAEPEQEPESEPREDAPADEPADEPKPDTTEPAPPATPIRDVLENVTEVVENVVEVVVPAPTTPAPAPVVPVPTVPAPVVVTPTPTQPAPVDTPTTVDPPAEQPLPAPVVEVPALPVVGPVAGTGTVLPGLPPWTASPEQPDREPPCTSDRDDQAAPDHGRGVVRTITDRRTGQPVASRPTPAKPCPTPAGPDGQTLTAGSVKPPPPTGEQLIALTVGGAYSAPVLHRLTQLRPRGDIPAGRSEHVEPRPA